LIDAEQQISTKQTVGNEMMIPSFNVNLVVVSSATIVRPKYRQAVALAAWKSEQQFNFM